MRNLLLLALCAGAPASAHGRPPPPDPAAQLAADVTRLAGRGYRLRGLEVEARGTELRLALLLVGEGRARRLELRFAGRGARPASYREAAAPAPAEERVYAAERELLALLAAGPPRRLRAGCRVWHLESASGRVALDPRDHHVVARSASGDQAGELLAKLLAAALDDGATLAWAGSAADEPWAIDFELHGDRRQVLRARVDGGFRVVALEVRVAPPAPGWQIYRRAADLSAALRAGRRVQALVVDPDRGDHGRLIVRLRGVRFVIDLGDFAPGPTEGPC